MLQWAEPVPRDDSSPGRIGILGRDWLVPVVHPGSTVSSVRRGVRVTVEHVTRALLVQVANGDSPEARVHAWLLGARSPALDALIIHQGWPDDDESWRAFAERSRARVRRVDLGWRPSGSATRSRTQKIHALARLGTQIPQLVQRTMAYRPHLILSSQQRWDCAIAGGLALAARRPQVIHLHYSMGPWLGAEVLQRLRTCAHVIAVSDFIRNQALEHGVPPERITRVHNPVTPLPVPLRDVRGRIRAALGLPADSVLVGEIARLSPQKGQLDAIEAFARAANGRSDAHLVIVGGRDGSGLEEDDVRTRATAMGVGRRVHVLGRRPYQEALDVLWALDVFVHPSVSEPFGLAVAEASAAGKPVLAYADGAMTEVVEPDVTGLLAPRGDVSRLGDLLRHLLDDPDARHRMGQAGARRVAERFAPAQVGAQFEAVLRRVGEDHASRRPPR